MILWQPAQNGFSVCSNIWARKVFGSLSCFAVSSRSGTFGGGIGTAAPTMFSSTHIPRWTGDVRFGYEVTIRMLP